MAVTSFIPEIWNARLLNALRADLVYTNLFNRNYEGEIRQAGDTVHINTFGVKGSFAPIADFTLLSTAVETAREHGVDMKVGNILSGDNFYSAEGQNGNDQWKRMGVMAVEMEAAGLYCNAAYAGKRALCICTISDHLYREEYLSSDQRQTSFTQMMEIALDTAVKMAAL